ncbi:MAG: oxidoreductase [Rhodospirillaceae bacterium]|mgnify:CR=1 FL=1|nr:oxidoreductase [Rhodospirillaceae bacterium]|tara:strand:- start:305 stop:1780 length:1476 start_codon:yes stop_codon:yes gene_type:complete
MSKKTGLEILEARVSHDLSIIGYPINEWVPAKFDSDGQRVLDVLIVGGGQGGLAIAFQLLRERVSNILIVDSANAGNEGPWLNYARMPILRSPKEVNGPDLNIPSLAFQSWYEAQYGRVSWSELNKIPTKLWAEYLQWYRKILNIQVENNSLLESFGPSNGFQQAMVKCLNSGCTRRILTRKIVLATGIETPGKWWAPPVSNDIPKDYWFHASELIDFSALRKKRIAILGAGASAMDNAVAALEANAAEVTVYSRRQELQRVQPFKWLSFPGFLRHFCELDDEWRWQFMSHLLTLREAFPRETWERANSYNQFRLQTGAQWNKLTAKNGQVFIKTPKGIFEADFLIFGTGFSIDLFERDELKQHAPLIALWSDRHKIAEDKVNATLLSYPYLGGGFQFLEKEVGCAPWLKDIHLFTFGATMSFGPSGSSINAMKFAVPRLVNAITRDLFLEDVHSHFESMRAYDLPEFLLPGEDRELAPASTDFYGKRVGS